LFLSLEEQGFEREVVDRFETLYVFRRQPGRSADWSLPEVF
jgi:hypothetical protein